MPSTHLSLHYHVVFSTKDRRPTISVETQERLHAYLGGILRTMGVTPLEIGGARDHVHLVVGLRATHMVANVLRDLKGDSSRWAHDTLKLPGFAWQEGYGAFSVSRSSLTRVREYVRNQEEHHRVRTFQEEYRALLQKHDVAYDERFLW